MSGGRRKYPHLEPERQEILRYIHRRFNTVTLLRRRTGYGERRLQRRIRELLETGQIEQVGQHTEKSVYLRIFGLTAEGLRNVPSASQGSTVRG